MASTSPVASPLTDAAGAAMAAQHFHPPTPRELRAQAVHRLQIGILGLASMLLLVGLANIIMDRARAGDDARGSAAIATASPSGEPLNAATDPLADMGVVPDLPADEKASARSSGASRPASR